MAVNVTVTNLMQLFVQISVDLCSVLVLSRKKEVLEETFGVTFVNISLLIYFYLFVFFKAFQVFVSK